MKRSLSLNYRVLLAAGVLLCGAFVTGAFWALKELWPYEPLYELKTKAFPEPPDTKAWTHSTVLELAHFDVDSKVEIARRGGGITAFDNKALIMSYRGEFYLYENADGERSVTRLAIETENGYGPFQEFVADYSALVKTAAMFFTFIDVAYDPDSSVPSLLVTHHQWHEDEKCFTLRLSKLELEAGTPLIEQSAEPNDWTTVYDTRPCLPVSTTMTYFAGDQSGGRVVFIAPDSVLMSVGDYAFDGWNMLHIHPQDTASDYGKILRIDLNSGNASHISIGHRNPQGLLVDNGNNIWSTEHGPRGGDELNIIRPGANYGWPYVTFGVQYGMRHWPASATQNRHDGYDRPVFSWTPSIGVSNLIQVEGFSPEWDGDLLVTSLKEGALHRIRYSGQRAIFDERIVIGSRIRDIDQLDDGTIVMWTDDADIIEMTPAEPVGPDINEIVASLEGQKRRQALSTIGSCLQCHDAKPRPDRAYAPNLWGVFGRRIAGTDYDGYSDGLQGMSGKWDEETLDAFLRDVQSFSQDSNMFYPGIADPSVRAVVIEYLKSLH